MREDAGMNPPVLLSDAADLGVLISNAWPQSRRADGATLDATARVLERFPFFKRVQTVDIPFAGERRAFSELVRASGRVHTYTLTRVMTERGINLSALDAAERTRGLGQIIACFDAAAEAGASVLGLVSGARPAEDRQRADALACLEESLCALCDAARSFGLKILIEPLDYEAHKRAALGTTAEAAGIARRLAAGGRELRLCVDMAHLLLNGEEVAEAVAEAWLWLEEFHICNAVLDRAHPLFGDRHLPLGAPGVVDGGHIARTFQTFIEKGFFGGEKRMTMACEVMTPEGEDPLEHMAGYMDVLQAAWEIARVGGCAK